MPFLTEGGIIHLGGSEITMVIEGKKNRAVLACIALMLIVSTSGWKGSALLTDEAKIVFGSWEGNWEVYVMGVDGGNRRNLTRHPANDCWAVWSPSGELH